MEMSIPIACLIAIGGICIALIAVSRSINYAFPAQPQELPTETTQQGQK